MKKLNYLLVASLMAFSLVACGASKKTSQANSNVSSTLTNEQIEAKKQQLELMELDAELEIKAMEIEARKKRMQQELAATEAMEAGSQVLLTFCIDEAMDKTGEYMAGLGISSNQLDQKDALISANQVALSDITSRFLGVMKNGVEMYNKETNTIERNKAKESQLEGLAMSVGEKAINKHAEVVCRKIVTEKGGTYGAYVAVHVPLADVVNDIVNEMDVLNVDVDKSMFREKMLNTIAADQAKVIAEKEKQQAQLEQMKSSL